MIDECIKVGIGCGDVVARRAVYADRPVLPVEDEWRTSAQPLLDRGAKCCVLSAVNLRGVDSTQSRRRIVETIDTGQRRGAIQRSVGALTPIVRRRIVFEERSLLADGEQMVRRASLVDCRQPALADRGEMGPRRRLVARAQIRE